MDEYDRDDDLPLEPDAAEPEPEKPEKPAPRPADDAPPKPKSKRPAMKEKVICTVRPAMFRAKPFRYLTIVLVVLIGIALVIASQVEKGVPAWALWPGALIALGGVASWFVWWLKAHLWIKVVISNKRTIRHEGIVRRHSTEVLHDHLRSVDIQQTFMQRLTNVGYLGIDSAGQDGIEIEIRDIPGPYEIKAIIDRYREL